jgi:Haemolymph juvenile hormone binding protein (JHBP)
MFCALAASIIPTCPRNHPNIVQCITESVEKIRPNLQSGDFGGGFEVPALEPMFIDKIAMNRGADFQAIFSNLTVSGPGGFIVQNMK